MVKMCRVELVVYEVWLVVSLVGLVVFRWGWRWGLLRLGGIFFLLSTTSSTFSPPTVSLIR